MSFFPRLDLLSGLCFRLPTRASDKDGAVGKSADNETPRAILRLLAAQPTLSARRIAEALGLSPRGVQKSIDAPKNGSHENLPRLSSIEAIDQYGIRTCRHRSLRGQAITVPLPSFDIPAGAIGEGVAVDTGIRIQAQFP